MPSRRLIPSLAVALSLSIALFVVACGGGGSEDDGDGSFAGTTVRSEDGRLTVQVPEGAAPDGVEVEIALIEDDDLPAELRDIEGLGVAGYELSPDGAEFSEPLTVTFRLDPAELGLDLLEGAVPLGLLLTRDAAGEFEGLEDAVLSREDGLVVARGAMSHFSPSFVVWSETEAVALTPDSVDLAVGETVEVEVLAALKGGELIPVGRLTGFDNQPGQRWMGTAPFSTMRLGGAGMKAKIECNAPTDDTVIDAYSVLIARPNVRETLVAGILFDTFAPLIALAGEGTCRGAATPEASSTAAGGSTPTAQGTPRSSRNSYYEINVSGASGSTEINAGDTFNRLGSVPDAAPQLDLVGLDWTWANGSPDLLQLDVHTAGPLDEAVGSILLQIDIVGETPPGGDPVDDLRLGAGLEITDGAVLCSLTDVSRRLRYELEPGEACEVAADGHWHVVMNVSEMPRGPLTLNMVALPLTGAGPGEDSVTIKGLTLP
jgi:hypothetical protein